MLNYESLKRMPLEMLCKYYGILKSICEKHEIELKPYFDAVSQRDQNKWIEINTELQKARLYCDAIFKIMKEKTFKSIDDYCKKEDEDNG